MKINISKIIIDHFSTLRESRSIKISKFDIVLFYIIPLLGPVGILSWKPIGIEAAKTLVVIASIVAPLLFNVLVLVITINHEKINSGNSGTLIKELCVNLSYSIVVIVLSIPVMLSLAHIHIDALWVKYLLSAVLAYICTHCFLTLFMVMKRAYSLISYQLDNK